MVYLVAFGVVVVALVGFHELALRFALRRLRRHAAAIAIASAASYLAIAALAFAAIEAHGLPSPRRFFDVERVLDDYDAYGVLSRGDRIVAIDGAELFADRGPTLAVRVNAAGGRPVTLTIVRAGQRREVTVRPKRAAVGSTWLLGIALAPPERTFDGTRAAREAIAYPVMRLVAFVSDLVSRILPSDSSEPVRMVEAFSNAFEPTWAVFAQGVLLPASVVVLVLQILADAIRLRGRRGAGLAPSQV